jgi:histidine triad (HIT) family protein
LFCRIARRAARAHVLHEDAQLIAFLVRAPIRPGHSLVIPKGHFPYFDDLPAGLAASVVLLGQKLAAAMKQIYGVPRAAFLFTGGDIAHVHAHVVPIHCKTDITSRRYIAEEKLTFRDVPLASDRELAPAPRRILPGRWRCRAREGSGVGADDPPTLPRCRQIDLFLCRSRLSVA